MIKKLFLISFLFIVSSYAESNFGSIATGSQQGTYIKIGHDISNLFSKYKAHLKVIDSKGSFDNLDILTGKTSTQKANWAIVQNDALEYYRFQHFKDTKEDLREKVKTVMPLYSEHIHVFTKKGKQIKFERGGFLKVAVPSKKSGATITAHLLENAFGVRFKYVYASFEEAKNYLQDGVIDIFIDVIAMPSNKYKNATNVDLVTIPKNPKFEKLYIPTTFSKNEYPWLSQDTLGYKVPSVIVTNQVDPKYDVSVAIFLKIIIKNYDILKKDGNTKWNEAYLNLKYHLDNMHPATAKILKP